MFERDMEGINLELEATERTHSAAQVLYVLHHAASDVDDLQFMRDLHGLCTVASKSILFAWQLSPGACDPSSLTSSHHEIKASLNREQDQTVAHCNLIIHKSNFAGGSVQGHHVPHGPGRLVNTASNYSKLPTYTPLSRGICLKVWNVPFPEKVYCMLNDAESSGLDQFVSWVPHGRSFTIHKPAEFAQFVLPKFFRHNSLSLFQCQLSQCGFDSSTHGNTEQSYHHELFMRGKARLVAVMGRHLAAKQRHTGSLVRRTTRHFLFSDAPSYERPVASCHFQIEPTLVDKRDAHCIVSRGHVSAWDHAADDMLFGREASDGDDIRDYCCDWAWSFRPWSRIDKRLHLCVATGAGQDTTLNY